MISAAIQLFFCSSLRHPRARSTVSSTRSRLTGFSRKSNAPNRVAWMARSIEAWPVMTTSGRPGARSAAFSSTCMPSRPGMERSMKPMSSPPAEICLTASLPSRATTTLYSSPSSTEASSAANALSSSAMRTRPLNLFIIPFSLRRADGQPDKNCGAAHLPAVDLDGAAQ